MRNGKMRKQNVFRCFSCEYGQEYIGWYLITLYIGWYLVRAVQNNDILIR